ncbi:TPA: HNH endonuclease, partial [Kluyvera ascorbata]|nr:HNH endonuclease [Kluyvera ascorbata]
HSKHVVCPKCNITIRAANLDKHLAKHEANPLMMPRLSEPKKSAKSPKKVKPPVLEIKRNAVKSSAVLRDNAGKEVSGWADKLNRTGAELRALYEGRNTPIKEEEIRKHKTNSKFSQNSSCIICKTLLKSSRLNKHYKKVHGIDIQIQGFELSDAHELSQEGFVQRWFSLFSDNDYSEELVQAFKSEANDRGFNDIYVSDFLYVINPIANPLQDSPEPLNGIRGKITSPETRALSPEWSYGSVEDARPEEKEELFFERWLRLFSEKGYSVAMVQAFRRDAEINNLSNSEIANLLEVVKPPKKKSQLKEVAATVKKIPISVETNFEANLSTVKGLKKDIHTVGRDSQEQAAFRKAVSVNYNHRCAITGDEVAVEACHIQTHANYYDNSLDNGVLLSVGLHRLFDAGIMIICPETMTINFTHDCFYKKYLDGAFVKQGRIPINKAKLFKKNSEIKLG